MKKIKIFSRKIPAWLGIAIIAVVGLAALIFVLEVKLPFGKTKIPQPKEVFSYSGEIVELKEGKIIFIAKKEENIGLKRDKTITATVSDKTVYIGREKLNILPTDLKTGEGLSLLSRQKISFADLKKGDKIIAVSSENIKNRSSFEAVKIEVIAAR